MPAKSRSSSTSPTRTGSSSSSGLKGSLKAKATVEEEEQLQALSMLSSGLGIDAATQLGLKFQQNQYEQRRKALISPDAYARDRAAAYTELTTSVNDTYAAAAKKYTSSGLPPDMAKQFALQAARNESQIQQQLFELSFPSGANVLELSTQAATTNSAIPGFGAAQPRRRAPARRRRR